ncbi:MAG: DNA polymerase IV [Parvibaculaceae bacterium]
MRATQPTQTHAVTAGPESGFCRDCLAVAAPPARRCASCGSPRLIRHPELHRLTMAHLDCDAFYAAIEKRDDPALRDKPLIVGGARRGVVSTACYIARIKGVRSAMPMFKALKLCPEATVVRPDMAKYVEVGREVRRLMQELTPLVQPLSIDEAFLDLAGTERLHGMSPALALARLALRIEREIRITVSIGLSHNKFLAKVASDLDKPRGFSVIGRAETLGFLAARPVGLVWGVGAAMQKQLARDGISSLSQIQAMEKGALMRRYGSMGARLFHLARGEDVRTVSPDDEMKSVSAETTFNDDIADASELERILWNLSEKVSRRAKAKGLAGKTVTLKLKTAGFRIVTRSQTLGDPTQLAERMFEAARPLLRREADGTAYRLIGIGISHLSSISEDPALRDLDTRVRSRAQAERALDRVRDRFGRDAIGLGRGFRPGGEDD